MARVTPGDPGARKGLLITLEGGDGAGKSTQARRLRNRLARAGHSVLLVVDPGGTALGQRLRRLLKFFRHEITPQAELLLFLASRAQLTQEVILPALAQGAIVVCDRYADSTVAYQGYGRGLDLESIHRLNARATQELRPQPDGALGHPRRRRPCSGALQKPGTAWRGTWQGSTLGCERDTGSWPAMSPTGGWSSTRGCRGQRWPAGSGSGWRPFCRYAPSGPPGRAAFEWGWVLPGAPGAVHPRPAAGLGRTPPAGPASRLRRRTPPA